MKRRILRLVEIVSIAVVMILALAAVNMSTVSVAEAGKKAEKEDGYTETDGPSLFWD